MFHNAKTYKPGSSDFCKLVVCIIKLSYKKRLPGMIKYTNYEYINNSLNENLAKNIELKFNSFEETVLNLLSSQVPF